MVWYGPPFISMMDIVLIILINNLKNLLPDHLQISIFPLRVQQCANFPFTFYTIIQDARNNPIQFNWGNVCPMHQFVL